MSDSIYKITSKIVYEDSICYLINVIEDNILKKVVQTINADNFVDDSINTESILIKNIVKCCEDNNRIINLNLQKRLPSNVLKIDHYNHLIMAAETLANHLIYESTKSSQFNFIICSSDVHDIFTICDFYHLNYINSFEGTYIAGFYKGVPVLLSPALDKGTLIFGVNDPNSPAIITFTNKNNKICNKIVNVQNFALVKIRD